MYRPIMHPTNDKDPRLESVADKLAHIKRRVDEREWHGKLVPLHDKQAHKRLTSMVLAGRLWVPKF